MIGSLFSLVFFGLIIWGIVSIAKRFTRGSDEPGDATVSFRRLFIYLLLLAALAIAATGIEQLLEILFDRSQTIAGDDTARQARGFAFLLIGGPSYVLLFRHVTSRLRVDPTEETSAGWRIYLNATLGISLITAMATLAEVIRAVFDVSDYSAAALASGLVATGVWLFHWFGPLQDHPPQSGFHLAVGSLAGLAAIATGIVLVVLAATDAVYDSFADTALAETPPADRLWEAVSAFAVGAPVWWWHWLRPSRRLWDPTLWNGYVVIAGVLAGVLTAVSSLYSIVFGVAVWVFGDRDGASAAEHFDFLPTAIAFGVTGLVVWAYHAWIYNQVQAGRTEPVRIYEYTMAGVGLIAAAGGITTLIVAFIQAVGPAAVAGDEGAANVLIAAVSALVIGGPLWWLYWNRIEGHYDAAPQAEATSTSRRIYTLALFGVSAIVAFVSLLIVAFIAFEDLFDGKLGGDTILDARVAIALTITTGLLTWYHYGIYRRDRNLAESVQPIGPGRITIIGRLDREHLEALRNGLDGAVRLWERTDATEAWAGDITELLAQISESSDPDVLVLLQGDVLQIVPFRTG